MRSPLIIGTRGSELALWQAHHVKALLEDAGIRCELKIIKTQGDAIQHLSFDKLEGKGFFTKEIEEALLNEETDIAVHSHKDLPTESPEGLMIAAVSDREDPCELLLIRKEKVDARNKFSLGRHAVVGTSSARRKSQLLAFRSDIHLKELRGNVPTRIHKLREGQYDAILIAAAGVERLELDVSDLHVERLHPLEFIPAPAQGVLAIQIRSRDTELIRMLRVIHRPEVQQVIGIERKILQLFEGGCQMPVAVHADYDDEEEVYHVRVSRSAQWEDLPVSIYAESKDPAALPARVMEKFRAVRPASVFITRESGPDSFFRRVLEGNGFRVEGSPLIDTRPVPFGSVPECDWIFFSSKHAVYYFFKQNPVLGSQRFACVGKATAEALRKYGKRADFIGSNTDTRMAGKQFFAKAGSGKVLFPQAKGSMRSIQQQMVKKDQIIDLVVYETLHRGAVSLPKAEILVFTSPSNVEAWLERGTIPRECRLVAMGDATAHTLKQAGFTVHAKPDTFDEAGLARAVFGVSGYQRP